MIDSNLDIKGHSSEKQCFIANRQVHTVTETSLHSLQSSVVPIVAKHQKLIVQLKSATIDCNFVIFSCTKSFGKKKRCIDRLVSCSSIVVVLCI